MLKNLSFQVKRDIILKKGTDITFLTDDNKFWLASKDRQITYPRQGFKIKDDAPERLWLIKNNTRST